MNRPKIKSTLFRMLEDAGKVLKAAILKPKAIHKKGELDLVTATDKKCEKIIVRAIQRNFPSHAILTEESPPMGNSDCRWIVDPLDGTCNFAHSFPVASVSIAYEEAGKIQMGGVLDPFRGELFFAERGKGASLNGKKIHVSSTPLLNDALVCTGFPYNRRDHMEDYIGVFKTFLMRVQDLRRVGSAALDLCYVAAGRFDGYWEFHLQPWDKAAAMLIVEEAGGRLSNFSGDPLTLTDTQNLASNGKLHAEMLALAKPFRHVAKNNLNGIDFSTRMNSASVRFKK